MLKNWPEIVCLTHGGVRQPGAADVRQFAAIGTPRRAGIDSGLTVKGHFSEAPKPLGIES
jgi:hypothetical protein